MRRKQLKPARGRHLAQALLAGLGAQGQPRLLRQPTGQAQQRRGGIKGPPDRGQVVLQPIVGIGLDQQQGPVRGQAVVDVGGRPDRVAHVVEASKIVTRS
jgi:hypothetical protein